MRERRRRLLERLMPRRLRPSHADEALVERVLDDSRKLTGLARAQVRQFELEAEFARITRQQTG